MDDLGGVLWQSEGHHALLRSAGGGVSLPLRSFDLVLAPLPRDGVVDAEGLGGDADADRPDEVHVDPDEALEGGVPVHGLKSGGEIVYRRERIRNIDNELFTRACE